MDKVGRVWPALQMNCIGNKMVCGGITLKATSHCSHQVRVGVKG